MTPKYRFSYICISIVICLCVNIVFSGKVKAGVKDDIKAAVAGGQSYAKAVTGVINAGADPAKSVIAAIKSGGPVVAVEVTQAAISAGGIHVAYAVVAASIIAGGKTVDVVNVVMTAYRAGADPVLLIAAIRDIVDEDTLQKVIDALIAAGADSAALEEAAEAAERFEFIPPPAYIEQPNPSPAE